MKPEDKSRLVIDKKLKESGWAVQDVKSVNLTAALGIAVREFPTSTGPVDYALFVDGVPVGVIESKKAESGENITVVEGQSSRYANSTLKWIKGEQRIRFAYEATDKLVRFTDDEDVVLAKAKAHFATKEPDSGQIAQAQKLLVTDAVAPFQKPEVRDYIENVRRSHEQIIDNVNLDKVLFAGFDSQQEKSADMVISSFCQLIEENKDEIIALRIIYDQNYKDRPMAIDRLKELYEKLKAKGVTVERLWDCYAIKKPEKVKRGTLAKLVDLISIVRFEMGYVDNLSPFADRVNYNFMQWTLRRNAGAVHFTDEQMEWLRLVKDHIAVSLSIEPSDLDLNPFDRKGGLGRFYEIFGEGYAAILTEMNLELVA